MSNNYNDHIKEDSRIISTDADIRKVLQVVAVFILLAFQILRRHFSCKNWDSGFSCT